MADALSRAPEGEETDGETVWVVTCGPMPEFLSILRKENAEAQDLKGIRQQYERCELSEDYKLVDDIITFKGKYYLSEKSELKESLLKEFHCSLFAGHGGIKKTLVGLSSMFYWPKMRRDVKEFIRGCTVCQQVKYMTTAPAGLLQPLPIPALVWNDLTMDFITHLPLSRGCTVILVVVDRLTKAAHFGALPTSFTASKVAQLFVEMVVRLHGFPSTIVSDRDPVFLNKFWAELFRLSGTKLKHNSAYHPQTDGQTEVVNRGLEQYL